MRHKRINLNRIRGLALRALRGTLSGLLLMVVTSLSHAAIGSSNAPISIEADSAELQETLSTYNGNVRVVQGGVTMKGARLIVRRGRGNSFTFTLSGGPASINQAPEKSGDPEIRGNARRIDYTSGTETLELRGNAVIFRGKERIAGGDIRYSFKDRRTIVNNRSGGANNNGSGRVQITLQPGTVENNVENNKGQE